MSEQIVIGADLPRPSPIETRSGTAVVFSRPAPGRTTGNEDAAGFWELESETFVLAVADGVGGYAGGAEAAAIAIRAIGSAITPIRDMEQLRSGILDGFEEANRAVLGQGIGSATTLVVAEVHGNVARTYHAGDSGALLVGQRGAIRSETIPHSPVGYGVASGLLDPGDAHHHEERHLLFNCIGSREMRVEVGAPARMAVRDTLLLATDGVLDNIHKQELIDTIRVGAPLRAANRLVELVAKAMAGENAELPAHPDDATGLLFRRTTT
jgi:serine/threonine protein phosphatase PrpC